MERNMFRFKIALQFLTRFPVQLSRMPTDQEIANSLVWYSVIGVLIGGLMAITGYLLAALPGYITAALVLTLWIVLTGALHLDGFADTVDAWVGGYGVRERTLELMKDQPYKQELINELPEGEEISFYKQGDFTDLCAGPHCNIKEP